MAVSFSGDPQVVGQAADSAPGQFSARLGMDHDPFYLKGDEQNALRFNAPSLTLQADLNQQRLDQRQDLLHALNEARRDLDRNLAVRDLNTQQSKAFELLASATATDAFDLAKEPEDIAKTVYYAMGIRDLSAIDAQGRPFNLLEDGRPLTEIF